MRPIQLAPADALPVAPDPGPPPPCRRRTGVVVQTLVHAAAPRPYRKATRVRWLAHLIETQHCAVWPSVHGDAVRLKRSGSNRAATRTSWYLQAPLVLTPGCADLATLWAQTSTAYDGPVSGLLADRLQIESDAIVSGSIAAGIGYADADRPVLWAAVNKAAAYFLKMHGEPDRSNLYTGDASPSGRLWIVRRTGEEES